MPSYCSRSFSNRHGIGVKDTEELDAIEPTSNRVLAGQAPYKTKSTELRRLIPSEFGRMAIEGTIFSDSRNPGVNERCPDRSCSEHTDEVLHYSDQAIRSLGRHMSRRLRRYRCRPHQA